MEKENLIVLSKYEGCSDIAPSEQMSLCKRHYEAEKEKGNVEGFCVDRVISSMPETWCEICTPPEWGNLIN